MSEGKKNSFLKRVQKHIELDVLPAYNHLITYCIKLREKSDNRAGAWKHPEGVEFYNACLRRHTTTTLSAEEIHSLGLQEVSRLEKEVRTLLDSLGIQESMVKAYANLSKDPRFLYPDTRQGKEKCLEDYTHILKRADSLSALVFDLKPKADIEVKAIPSFKEKNSSGAYYSPPAMNGSRPGTFYANLRDMTEIPRWSMFSLAAHEAIPGHHFQVAIQQELKGVPTFRKILPFTAYMEGWALYAERLMFELGAYKKDPYSCLGYYQAQLFRAARLVVDTGIHSKKWTREQALAYMLQHAAIPQSEAEAEIDRYIVDPGQACAYMVGQLKIIELRERVKKQQGEKFSIQDFHRFLLQNGSMPLEVMEKLVVKHYGLLG